MHSALQVLFTDTILVYVSMYILKYASSGFTDKKHFLLTHRVVHQLLADLPSVRIPVLYLSKVSASVNSVAIKFMYSNFNNTELSRVQNY